MRPWITAQYEAHHRTEERAHVGAERRVDRAIERVDRALPEIVIGIRRIGG